ncbi:MAG: hypothetical protein GX986_06835 [Firmicutes bacterium]|nr:hypothetical protein [Bacillota bacterium]
MTATKIRKQIYITPEQNEDLKTLALMDGVSEASIIREALSTYVAARQKKAAKKDPLADLIGLGVSKHTDSALRHDHYLHKDETP